MSTPWLPTSQPKKSPPCRGYATGRYHQPVADDLAVEVSGLTKRFGKLTVVDNVDLRVQRGSAFGYLGPNGAGKTTLIRILLGLTRADAGTMRVLGFPIPEQRAAALARVGAIVDEPRFHGYLTGRENLRVLAAAREPAAHGRITPALKRVGLADKADMPVSKYSMGMRQRLGIAGCLLADPELLVLDEPMNGLDPAGMLELRQMIRSFVGEGRTVILSSHLLDEVEKTCDAVAIVDHGHVVVQGSIAEVTGNVTTNLLVRCTQREEAGAAARMHRGVADIRLAPEGIVLVLGPGVDRWTAAAEVNRMLVERGVWVYGLESTHASLEERFLEITSRLGSPA